MTERNSKTPRKASMEKKPASGKVKKKAKKVSIGKVFWWTFVAGAVAAICAMGVYIFIIVNGNRILTENLDKLEFSEASHIYDVHGQEAGSLKVENRENVDSSEIPDLLKKAFVATEDKRFEEHAGVDFLGIGRALVKDIVARSMVEGGSTITQQLAKNVFLSSDKTFFRKATEMSIAVALEQRYTKDEILSYYLNRIYFGKRAYGVKAASKVYFGVSDLNQLKLWQMATLAAMPKAPNAYNPLNDPEKSMERRAVVLKLMQEQGYITEAQRAEAAAVEYTPPKGVAESNYQTYIDYVLKEAQDMYGFEEDDLLRGGYKIYTTLDPVAQRIMEQTYANNKFFQKDGPQQKMQSSMVILNNEDGGIVAMIGGRDYVTRGLNRAVSQPRQPGSAFKPLVVFAPAIEEKGYTPYSRLRDEQRSYNGYSPRNYDGVYRGEVTMQEAIRRSINMPAVDLLNEIGVRTGRDFVRKLGIELTPEDNNLAIALGGLHKGVTTLQMAGAYSAFANNGYMNKPHAIIKITNDKGEVASFKEERKSPVMSAKTAWYMTQMLRTVVEPGGTGTAAKFERPVAGKTGSTQLDIKGLERYMRDLWFVGYTPEWTAAVWMGFDKTDSKHYVSMSSGSAAAIFKEVMQKSLTNRPVKSFKRPAGVEEPAAPPKAIGDLTAEYQQDKRSVHLRWSGVGSGVSYQLFRKDSKMQDFPAEPLITTTATEVNDISAIQPDTYQYVVVPLNGENNTAGPRSNVVSVTVPEQGDDSNPLHPELPGTDPNEEQADPNDPGTEYPDTGESGTRPGERPGTGLPGTDRPGNGYGPGGQTGPGRQNGGKRTPDSGQNGSGTGTDKPRTDSDNGTGGTGPAPPADGPGGPGIQFPPASEPGAVIPQEPIPGWIR
ncbi:PBP1A family penicillin-binding protein [Paenibacillus naphthalenovorans]|uniref:PBP1A family penicillin-binding protein n=1 Tax=Paenibacillus naphthalenovorans TaxID=162209 RepID=UPI003D26EE5D